LEFGVSESCLQRWLELADIEDGNRPGVTQADAAESAESKEQIRLLEQENEILRRAVEYRSRSVNPVARIVAEPGRREGRTRLAATRCWRRRGRDAAHAMMVRTAVSSVSAHRVSIPAIAPPGT
jgi:hypothetical protein